MNVTAHIYLKGRPGKIGGYSSPEIVAPEDIDQFLEDLGEYLNEQLERINEEET